MFCPGVGRRQQQEYEVDRLVVDCFERHRPLEPGKDPVQPGQLGEPAVRHRDAGANARRAQPLALGERVVDALIRDAGHRRRAPRKLLQHLALGRRTQLADDAAQRHQIGEFAAGLLINLHSRPPRRS